MGTLWRWRRGLGRCILAAPLLGAIGCLSCCHPVPPPLAEQTAVCHAVPKGARSHVYVFLVDDLDPLNFCNLAGVHDYLIALGFNTTYQGEIYHCFYFNDEIRAAHKRDPNARFVLVGHGVGAHVARAMANDLREDKIPVSLMIYLDSTLSQGLDAPENVQRTINVRAPGYLWDGVDLASAENVHLGDASHFSTPTHPRTLELLGEELTLLAMTVPVPRNRPGQLPELGPTPRPLKTMPPVARKGWDFLTPSPTLNVQASPAPPSSPASPASPTPHTSLKPNVNP